MTTESDEPGNTEPPTGDAGAGASNALLEAALSYAKRGWSVLPLWECKEGVCACRDGTACGRPGKHPRISGWVKEATADESQIHEWWKSWPNANVGIATGKESGIFVIDRDGDVGSASLLKLIKEHGELPRSPESRTGEGSHRFFRYPASVRIGSFSNSNLKIDVRGDGGYVVAPPSVHQNGKQYEWVVAPEDLEPADAPDWLIREIETWSAQGRARAGAADQLRVGEGGRNTHLHGLGSVMRGRGASDETVRVALVAENQDLDLPLDNDEVERTVSSILTYERGASVDAAPLPDPGFLTGVVDAQAFSRQNFQTRPSILGEGLLGQGELGILYGQPGTNKSFLMLYLAVAVATGEAWFGQTTSQTNVGVISLEVPGAVLQRRLRVVGGAELTTLFPIPRETAGVSFDVTSRHVLSKIIDMCKELHLGLLVLDPLSRIHTRDENAALEMGAVLNALQRLSQETRTSVLVVHHEGKQGRTTSGSGDLAALRGSARLESDPTLLMRMVRLGDHERVLRFVKSNFAQLPEDVFLQEDPATGGLSVTVRRLRGREQGNANRELVRQALNTVGAAGITLRDLRTPTGLSENALRDHLHDLGASFDRADLRWRLPQGGAAA
jgi:archaellum biogenesis ATPase FlaH